MILRGVLQSLGIRARVLILAVLPVASVVALLGYNLAISRLEDAERSLAERGSLVARNLALASEFALFSQNMPLINDTLQRLAEESDVRWSAVWDVERRTMLSGGDGPDEFQAIEIVAAIEEGRELPPGCYFAPIRVDSVDVNDFGGEFASFGMNDSLGSSQLLGFAVVEVSLHGMELRRAEIVLNSVMITLAGLAASILLALLIGNSITEPVIRLLNAVRELRAGNLAARVRVRAGGEMGNLEMGINQMAEALEASQHDLKLRVDDATAALRNTVAELEVRNHELYQAREMALRAGQERTEFLARMSHEIRTPLNAVVGFAKLLKSDNGSQTNNDHLRTIQHAADQLLHVINDILQFIRLDSGADELESMSLNIGEVLEDVIAMLAPMASEKQLELVLLLHSDLPQSLQGDPKRLSQIVINLINNAIKFTAEGWVSVEAHRVTLESGVEELEISVRDTGIGLDPGEQSRIFEPFSQSDSTITRRFGGTGLGLSIAKRLSELMGGSIGVESRKGQGSRFWVRLPCDGFSEPAATEVEGPLVGKMALVYDSNPFSRRSLRNSLATWGMQVFNSGRWEQVLKTFSADAVGSRFDTVILGLSPAEEKAGIIQKYLYELRRHHAGHMLILTGSQSDEALEPSGQHALVNWATKPIRRLTLKHLLSAMFEEGMPTSARQGQTMRLHRLLGLQVLVAEDNEFNRQLLKYILEDEGASVDEAVSGKSAINAAVRGGYDVVLMDLHMPEIDGAAAARQIRNQLGRDAPPILALTADVFGRSDLADAELAFDDWLLKPIDAEGLVTRLATLRYATEHAGSASVAVRKDSDTVPDSLRERYLIEIENLVERLRMAAQAGDSDAAGRAHHDLKGIVGMCGDMRLAALTSRLDSELFSHDPAAADALLEELRRAAVSGGEN